MTSMDRLNIGKRLDIERYIRKVPNADLSIRDLANLAEGHDAEGRVEKIYDWRFERRELVAQAALAFMARFLSTWCIPYFKMLSTSRLFVPLGIVSVGGVGDCVS
jgi:hypothetical protein